MAKFWENIPILGWAIDDWQTFYEAASFRLGNTDGVNNYINRYATLKYDNYIHPMFFSASLPLNLGGKTEKEKLITTSVPQGVFDFSLASQGLYKVPAYYSAELAEEYPDLFESFGTVSGIVPPNEVRKDAQGFYYEYKGKRYSCVIKQKGQVEKDLGMQGAKLKFATRTKKVYLTFKRNKGKVKYVEIYSLMYYAGVGSNDAQYAIRQIPLLMVAEYLESIGIKTRIYITRFVYHYNGYTRDAINQVIGSFPQYNFYIRENWRVDNNIKLPLFEESPSSQSSKYLLIQPIIVKDFGEEIDKKIFFCTSSQQYDQILFGSQRYCFRNELTGELPMLGSVTWTQSQYKEGFERFLNKYQIYNKRGIFKSKEVLPEALIFYHDKVINTQLQNWIGTIKNMLIEFRGLSNDDEIAKEISINNVTNPFFNWWMRLSASHLKNKILLINSNELVKDLREIEKDINNFYDELQDIVRNTPQPITIRGNEFDEMMRKFPQFIDIGTDRQFQNKAGTKSLQSYFSEIGRELLLNTNERNDFYGYNILNQRNEVDVKQYVLNITDEITIYADGIFFQTTEESVERRNELVKNILQALKSI